MARQGTILSVFVASPSDVEEERNLLEEVIREFNVTRSRDLGIHLELIRWETHAFPGFGEDAQAVVNDQIPDDYDLFIGLMWYRFGTPTGRAGSGTIEEFQRAKERYDHDPTSVHLMFYFKDAPAPVPPTKLDPAQLAQIAEFRSSLGDEGGLYWSFPSVKDFERLVRLHISRYVQAWRSKNLPSAQPDPADETTVDADSVEVPETIDQEDEPGLLDLMEEFEDAFNTIAEIFERMTAAGLDITNKMNARTTEMNEFSEGPDAGNRKAFKRIITKSAADMDQYVYRMEAEIPLFSNHLNNGMNAIARAAALSIEIRSGEEDLEQLKETIEGIQGTRDTFRTVEGQISDFQQAVTALPKMTSKLNQSKRAVVKVLQRLIDEIHSGQAIMREAEISMVAILEQQEIKDA